MRSNSDEELASGRHIVHEGTIAQGNTRIMIKMKKIQSKKSFCQKQEHSNKKNRTEENRTKQNLKRTIQLRTARNTRICPTGSLIS